MTCPDRQTRENLQNKKNKNIIFEALVIVTDISCLVIMMMMMTARRRKGREGEEFF